MYLTNSSPLAREARRSYLKAKPREELQLPLIFVTTLTGCWIHDTLTQLVMSHNAGYPSATPLDVYVRSFETAPKSIQFLHDNEFKLWEHLLPLQRVHNLLFIQHRQTKTVIMLDIFETSMTSIRWWKWFTQTGQIITVTGQIRTAIHTTTRAVRATSMLPCLSRTHTQSHAHAHTLCAVLLLVVCFS